MKRKLLALLSLMLCLVLAFSLTSCFGSKDDEEEEVDPKVKAEKWNQYFNLDGLNSFTVKVSNGERTETFKASDGYFVSTGSGESGYYNSSSLVDFINNATGINLLSTDLDYSSATFDKKTSSYKLTCYDIYGEEYTANVYFADKVLTKMVGVNSSGKKVTLTFSKWNKTSF